MFLDDARDTDPRSPAPVMPLVVTQGNAAASKILGLKLPSSTGFFGVLCKAGIECLSGGA
jgi:hypothetical protein